jgi:predicted acyl esterase
MLLLRLDSQGDPMWLRRLRHHFISISIAGLTLGSARPGHAQAPRANPAAEYFATQVDAQEMVRIPMRDGIRLNGTIYFAKNQPRQNLPTVLWFFPYHINGVAPWNQKLLEHGYAVAYVNSRGRYFSEGTYTFLTGSGNDSYDTIDWIA